MKYISQLSLYVLSIIVLTLSSCEKEIDLNIEGADAKLVVQASIERNVDPNTGAETGQPPIVILTTSLSYFGNVDSAALASLFIHDADVYISDGTQEIKLREYDFRFAPGQAIETAYFYSIDTSAGAPIMLGEFGKTYDLRIEWQGQSYTASAPLIAPVPVDSFWIQQPLNANFDTTYYEVRARFDEPSQKGQYYYNEVTSILQNGNGSSYEDVFNDEVVNGVAFNFTFLAEEFGEESTQRGYFIEGDSIRIKWSSINYDAYEFYNTKSFSEGAVGNPFATPVNVLGNISNGALGAFVPFGSYIYEFRIEP